MATGKFYFPHNFNARSDEKIKKIIRKHGAAAYGIYWFLVEDLYNNNNSIEADFQSLAREIGTKSKLLEYVVNQSGLFQVENGQISSLAVGKRIKEMNQRSDTYRVNAKSRYQKQVEKDCNSTAIAEQLHEKKLQLQSNSTQKDLQLQNQKTAIALHIKNSIVNNSKEIQPNTLESLIGEAPEIQDGNSGGLVGEKNELSPSDVFTELPKVDSENTLVGMMMRVWKSKFDFYQVDEMKDSVALRELGYKIGKAKKFNQQQILGEKKQEVVKAWESVVEFISGDSFYRGKALATINNVWQTVYSAMVEKDRMAKEASATPEKPKLKF